MQKIVNGVAVEMTQAEADAWLARPLPVAAVPAMAQVAPGEMIEAILASLVDRGLMTAAQAAVATTAALNRLKR